MPKIKITEQDLTLGGLTASNNIVFVPIKVTEDSEFGPFEPTLCVTVGQLEAICPEDNSDDDGWFIVKRLILARTPVLVQGVTALDEVDWEITGLADKSKYDIRFLTAGAFEHYEEGSGDTLVDDGTNALMMECAKLRGDAVALCDHPKSLTTSADIKAYAGTVEEEGTFGAMFAPWGNFEYENDEGSQTLTLPGSYSFLIAYAASAANNNPSWFAVAGSVRGVVPGLVSLTANFGSFDINTLQGRSTDESSTDENNLDINEGVAINPICFIRPFGILIWGNRTMKNNVGEEGTTALSFLNVRNLVSELKKVLYGAARTLTFEQNSDVLWIKFTSLVYPTLDRMLSGNGITGYKVIKQPTTAKARLKASVRIFPIEAVEDFELSVVLEDEGTVTVQ
jgi:hypothetical protein